MSKACAQRAVRSYVCGYVDAIRCDVRVCCTELGFGVLWSVSLKQRLRGRLGRSFALPKVCLSAIAHDHNSRSPSRGVVNLNLCGLLLDRLEARSFMRSLPICSAALLFLWRSLGYCDLRSSLYLGFTSIQTSGPPCSPFPPRLSLASVTDSLQLYQDLVVPSCSRIDGTTALKHPVGEWFLILSFQC